MTDPELTDQIYETALTGQGWPELLGRLARFAGARSAALFSSAYEPDLWAVAPGNEQAYLDFIAAGHHLRDHRIPRLISLDHPGFLTDSVLFGGGQPEHAAVYQEYLIPQGFAARAATALPRVQDGAPMVLSLAGFGSQAASDAAIPVLDGLRPHVARAAMLAAQMRLREARAAVDVLELSGVAAAVVSPQRRMLAANPGFERELAWFGSDGPSGLRLREPGVDARLGLALTRTGQVQGGMGASLPLQQAAPFYRGALHVLPLRGAARDMFAGAGALLMLSTAAARPRLSAQLIGWLLDLTPAEARLAACLTAGQSLAEAASSCGMQESTARTHLKRIFAKTGFSRQAELVAALGPVRVPQAGEVG